MLYDEDENDDDNQEVEATYTILVDGGRKVVMTGDPGDLDKIVEILTAYGKQQKQVAAAKEDSHA